MDTYKYYRRYEKTIGQEILNSTKINKLIVDLVNEVMLHNQKIIGPKDAIPDQIAQAEEKKMKIGSLRGRPLYHPYIGSSSGHGPYVELEDGSIKLDLINGIGIHVMGHGHPKLIEKAIRASISDIVMQGNLQPNSEYVCLTESLVKFASKNSRLKHAWLATECFVL